MADNYTDVERALLQYIISSGPVKEEYLVVNVHNKLKKGILEAENGPAAEGDEEEAALTPEQEILLNRTLEASIDLINNKLRDLGYKITKTISQISAEPYYVYVNTLPDEPAKVSISRSAKEISIVKKMIDYIVSESENEGFLIPMRDALKFCSYEGYSGPAGLQFLQSLVNEGWMNVTKKGDYTLSLRALAELKPMLIEKYGVKTLEGSNDDGGVLNVCVGCRDLVTIGLRCHNEDCNARFHKHCHAYYARANGAQCPNADCDVDWSVAGPLIVGPSRK
jgi:hypothetical protein